MMKGFYNGNSQEHNPELIGVVGEVIQHPNNEDLYTIDYKRHIHNCGTWNCQFLPGETGRVYYKENVTIIRDVEVVDKKYEDLFV